MIENLPGIFTQNRLRELAREPLPENALSSVTEVIKPELTDEQIFEANTLLLTKKELTYPEQKKSEELEELRKKEIERLFPPFDFGTISEIDGQGRTEAERQNKVAKEFFEMIQELNKVPNGVYSLALYLEKLNNRDINPESLDMSFPFTYRRRRFEIKERNKNSDKRNNLPGKYSEQSKVSINPEGLSHNPDIPNYLRVAVLYRPESVEDCLNELRSKFEYSTTKNRKKIIGRIEKNKR